METFSNTLDIYSSFSFVVNVSNIEEQNYK